jgi:hypothetical protein
MSAEKGVMICLGVGTFLISLKIHFLEELLSRMNAHLIEVDPKIVGSLDFLTPEIFQEIGIGRPSGKDFLLLISVISIAINFSVTVILLSRGKTERPHTRMATGVEG